MNDTNDQQRSSVAKWALFLFIFGLLAPFVLILLVLAFSPAKRPWDAVEQAVPFAVALGVIAEVLALILGIVGRRHVAGKIAWIGAAVVVVVAALAALPAVALVLWPVPVAVPAPPRGSGGWSPPDPRMPSAVNSPAAVDRPAEDQARAVHPTSTPAGAPRPVPKGPTTLPAGAAEPVKR